MTKDTLPFTEYYDKHLYSIFPTIRRRDKYGSPGDVLTVTINGEEKWECVMVGKTKISLEEIPEDFLIYDTCPHGQEEWGYEDAIEKLNSFYRNRIKPGEELTIYFLFRTEEL